MTTTNILNYAFAYQLKQKIYKLNDLILVIQKREELAIDVLRDLNLDLNAEVLTVNMLYKFLNNLIALLDKAKKLEQHIFQSKITRPEDLKVTSSNISLLFWYIKILDSINNLYSEISEHTDDLRFTLTRSVIGNIAFKNMLMGFCHIYKQAGELMRSTSNLLQDINNTELMKSGRTLITINHQPILPEDYYAGLDLE